MNQSVPLNENLLVGLHYAKAAVIFF